MGKSNEFMKHVSSVLNESSEIWCFKCNNAIEICEGKDCPYVNRASFHEINSHQINLPQDHFKLKIERTKRGFGTGHVELEEDENHESES